MLQNVKVDIIYYLTNTDFEMEFNLCGCCRMRLLTDKASDRKELVNMLARAVSRSKIIIACGGLFSENGLIETVAAAIGKDTATINNSNYGISGSHNIKIISGSTPLVTPEGYFGGCIIESGPQTIILLSENKGIRKTIMQKLIHPYIEEYTIQASTDTINTTMDTAAPILPITPDASVVPETPVVSEIPVTPEIPATPDITDTLANEQEYISSEEPYTEDTVYSEQSEQFDPNINTEEFVLDEEYTVEQYDDIPETPTFSPDIDIIAEPDNTVFEDEQNVSFLAENDNDEALGFVFDNADENEPNQAVSQLETDYTELDMGMHLVPEKAKYSKTNYYEVEYNTSEEDDMFVHQTTKRKKGSSLNIPIIILSAILGLLLLVLLYFLIIVPIIGGQDLISYYRFIFLPGKISLL